MWSPDGTKIAFVSSRDRNDEVYVMRADGTGVTNVTHNAASDELPSWSPDGTMIVFSSSRDGNPQLYITAADRSAVTRLTNNAAFDTHPVWRR